MFANVEAALHSMGAGWGNVVQFTTYLVHSQELPRFMKFRLKHFPQYFANGEYPPNTLLVVDRLVEEPFLVEVQTIAAVRLEASRFLAPSSTPRAARSA